MAYEFINRDCAENDHHAALKNFNLAEARLRELRRIWEMNGTTPAELLRHLHVYQACRERVIDIGQHIGRSFGRPTPPERPDWCPDLDTLTAT